MQDRTNTRTVCEHFLVIVNAQNLLHQPSCTLSTSFCLKFATALLTEPAENCPVSSAV